MNAITPWPNAKQLYTEDDISCAVAAQAVVINQTLGAEPLIALSVLTGGLVYSGLLLPKLTMPMQLDVVRVTRYRNSIQGSATLDWIIKPSIALRGARVLLMDDIFDEGKTLEALDQWIREQGASEVYSAVMINKLHTRKPAVFKPHFSAADAPDEYVFGMGMDYQGAWRNANGIWYLAP